MQNTQTFLAGYHKPIWEDMMKMSRFSILALLIFAAAHLTWAPTTNAQETCTHNGTSWNNPDLWSCNRVPLISDHVIIPENNTSVLNTNGFGATLTVHGTVHVGNNITARELTVAGDVNIESTGTIAPNTTSGNSPAHTMFVGGNLVNNGVADLRSEASAVGDAVVNVTFNGAAVQSIDGSNAIRFNNVTVANDATVAIVTQPTVKESLTNNGTLQESRTVNNSAVEFLHIVNLDGDTTKYRGVDIETSADLGLVTVSVRGIDTGSGEYCTSSGAGSPDYVERCYTIAVENPNNSATVRLWVSSGELNNLTPASLTPYHWDEAETEWVELGSVVQGDDEGVYSYGQGETSSFSSFLLAGEAAPTVVSLAAISAGAAGLAGPSLFLAVGLLILLSVLIFWLLPRRANAPTGSLNE